MQEQERRNPRPLDLKEVVMEVLGPKGNERSSTRIPLGFFSLLIFISGFVDRFPRLTVAKSVVCSVTEGN